MLVHCGDVLIQGGDKQPDDGTSGDLERRERVADVADWLGESGAASVLVRARFFSAGISVEFCCRRFLTK